MDEIKLKALADKRWPIEGIVSTTSETVRGMTLATLRELAAEYDSDLAAANRTITQLREDAAELTAAYEEELAISNRARNEAREDAARVRGRLDEAVALLDASPHWLCHKAYVGGTLTGCGSCWTCRRKVFLDSLASGSSTGEAPAAEQCGHTTREGRCRLSRPLHDDKSTMVWPHDFEPAAPEPAPAPHAFSCDAPPEHGDHFDCKCEVRGCGKFDSDPVHAAAPASAQGTGELTRSPEETRRVLLGGLAAGRIHLRLDDLDKRVAALEAEFATHTHWTAEEIAKAKEFAKRYDDFFKNAPPQPAPVERHAFVCSRGAVQCGEPSCPCARPGCGGQPRSAAVHGEGGK